MNTPRDFQVQPERPRVEPEIIPPGANYRTRTGASGMFVYVDEYGRARQRTFRAPGPLALALMLFVFFGLAGTLALLAFGFVLVWVPIAATLVTGAVATSLVRSYWRRFAGSRT